MPGFKIVLNCVFNRPSARLLKRPVPPPAAMEPKPDPIEVTRLQLAATRPAVPKPDKGRSEDYAEEPLLDRKSVTKVDNDKKFKCFSVVIARISMHESLSHLNYVCKGYKSS